MSSQSVPFALAPEKLRRRCQGDYLNFDTTAELDISSSIIGQPRGVRAIEFGIKMNSPGYNIYVMGEIGTGRTTTIGHFLEEQAREQDSPDDWVYVHNFGLPHQPIAIRLPTGKGVDFKTAMRDLVVNLKMDLPKAFDTDAYKDALEKIDQEFEEERDEMLGALRSKAAEREFTLIEGPSGFVVVLVKNGRILPPEEFETLPVEERESLRRYHQDLSDELDRVQDRLRQLSIRMRERVLDLDQKVGANAITRHFAHWCEFYNDRADILDYLAQMRTDILNNLVDFLPREEEGEGNLADLSRYDVNLFVDNSGTKGAPVILESNPTYNNLIGRIEYEIRFGAMTTYFGNLKAGSLHKANGGYLILNAQDILRFPDAWAALKRSIERHEIRLQSPDASERIQPLANSLDPQPIPLHVKVILLGNPEIYYSLYDQEEDFGELYKVKAEFDSVMPRDAEHEYEYARFVATICREEGLRDFDRSAVEQVIEHGSRLCGDQNRLSTRFGEVADLIREADHWAGQYNHPTVSVDDIRQAIGEHRYRANLLEEHLREEIEEGFVFIDTRDSVVGQVNSLTIIDMGDYHFGTPSRITARTYMGESGVINIEREVEMAGPLHNKGLLTLTGYLGGMYAQDQPLSLSASITFEQNYSSIDGDSAASSELYSLLSSLSDLPLKQSIAVTGSINQRGEIQPVGSVTEKIEGFYDVCLSRGLTGEEGVIIPAANLSNLMLREDVIESVAAGKFRIWAINHVDQGIELLSGIPAGKRLENGTYPPDTVHYAVQKRLRKLAQELKSYGDHSDD